MHSCEGEEQARSTAEAVARRSYGKLVAFLSTRTHDVAAAEDALSEAFASALADWPGKGCPANPEAWLLTVARRKLIDAARRQHSSDLVDEDLEQVAALVDADLETDPAEIPDRRLALMFA
ncbi:MAG: sigma factor, partial [Acidobacteriaceae bacterium]